MHVDSRKLRERERRSFRRQAHGSRRSGMLVMASRLLEMGMPSRAIAIVMDLPLEEVCRLREK